MCAQVLYLINQQSLNPKLVSVGHMYPPYTSHANGTRFILILDNFPSETN